MIPGKHSNLDVTDEEGDFLRPMGFVGETIEDSEYIIAAQKSFKQFDLHATYDLENFLELSDDGMWSKHFQFPHDVMIYFDDEIELIHVNDNPVNVSDVEGINCIGCDLKLEFFNETEPIIKKVIRNETKFEEISNSGEEFSLEFFSNGVVSELNYIQELNYLSFNVKSDQLVVLKIPLDLLFSPYSVYLTELDQEILLEGDKIKKSEFEQNDTHANISFKTPNEGIIHVVGATEMEHQKLLKSLEKRAADSQPENSKPDSLSDILRGEYENEKLEQNEAINENKEVFEEWINANSNKNEDNTIVLMVVGIVIAVIIGIGIAIKIKKN